MTLDMILTVVVLGFWFLFPIGMFLSVSHVDKNTDQLIRLEHLRHAPSEDVSAAAVSPRITEEKPRRRVGLTEAFHRRQYGH